MVNVIHQHWTRQLGKSRTMPLIGAVLQRLSIDHCCNHCVCRPKICSMIFIVGSLGNINIPRNKKRTKASQHTLIVYIISVQNRFSRSSATVYECLLYISKSKPMPFAALLQIVQIANAYESLVLSRSGAFLFQINMFGWRHSCPLTALTDSRQGTPHNEASILNLTRPWRVKVDRLQ